MKIVFRVDSGSHMGIGHVMRCLTLAHELKKKNHQISFITKNHKNFSEKAIADHFPVSVIDSGVPRDLSVSERYDYANWLGESWQSDLEKTNKILEGIGQVDLVIVDHYSLGKDYEQGLKCSKVMAIDDLMNRSHHCDLVLDQNITADQKRYDQLVEKKGAKLLMGPPFAMLRPEFEGLHKQVSIGDSAREINSILVFFGAADVNGDCLKIARALTPNEFSRFNITFILHSEHQDYPELSKLLSSHKKAQLLSFVANLAELMMKTDLFIGAGGTTSWERACLGVATALLSVADNQTLICQELGEKGICHYLGRSDKMTKDNWQTFFEEIVPQNSLWYGFRSRSYQLIDGMGTKRVALAIEEILNAKN